LKISYHERGLFIQDDFKIGRTFSLLTGWTIQQSQLDEPEPNFNSREFLELPILMDTLVCAMKTINWQMFIFQPNTLAL